MKRITACFEVKAWNETPCDEGLPKMNRAQVAKSYRGEIEAEGALEYLLMYRDDGTGVFVGIERVVGRMGGRPGGFVLQHAGSFEKGIARVEFVVVPGSGTGELRGLRGRGSMTSGHAREYPISFEYELEGE